jgi:hypothetical protein
VPTESSRSFSVKLTGNAHPASLARLMKTDAVLRRVNELRQALTASVLQLAITERAERLLALQDRWDALREAKACFGRDDFEGAMATGVVLRKLRSVRDGKDSRVVEEYEINTALIESLNSVERRAAIETGQEVDRQDINLRGKVNDQAEVLRKTFTFEEMRAMQDRVQATIEADRTGKLIEAPAVTEKEQGKSPLSDGGMGGAEGSGQAKGSSWRD